MIYLSSNLYMHLNDVNIIYTIHRIQCVNTYTYLRILKNYFPYFPDAYIKKMRELSNLLNIMPNLSGRDIC